jgi:hypothetical protein
MRLNFMGLNYAYCKYSTVTYDSRHGGHGAIFFAYSGIREIPEFGVGNN